LDAAAKLFKWEKGCVDPRVGRRIPAAQLPFWTDETGIVELMIETFMRVPPFDAMDDNRLRPDVSSNRDLLSESIRP